MIGRLWQRLVALPWYHPLKQAIRIVIYLAIGYVVLCVYLYVVQNRMIYRGASQKFNVDEAKQNAWMSGLVPWPPDGKGDLVGFVRRDFADPAPRGTIVLLHGNGDNAWQCMNEAATLKAHGFRALLYEYPGYGSRPGAPSEATIVPDVRATVRAVDQAGLGPVYLWGQSLGSGVAAAACTDGTLPVHGLILLLPWDTLPNAGAAHYPFVPAHLLMTDRYDSIANLAHFTHPICLLRADHDTTIPPRLSINLYAHLPGPKKEIVFKNCDHNDWPGDTPDSWWDEALDFIAPK
jgi:alpha-beta hydrolase superfamily lysophospholipase